MAEKPNTKKTITLIDGTSLEIRPLKLSLLKPFMAKFQELVSLTDDNDKSMSVLVECVEIAMKQYKPELADNKEQLEELLDLPTVYEIIDAATGMPNADASAIVGPLSR